MSALLSPTRSREHGTNGLALQGPGRSRRPLAAIGSLAIVLLSATVFATIYSQAGRQESILVVARDVQQGTALRATDLSVAHLSYSSELAPVPASQLAAVVGRRVSVPLMAGSLLEPDDLTGGAAVPTGEAVVGVAVDAAQLPAQGVNPGNPVNIVFTGQAGASGTASQGLQGGSSTGTAPTVADGGVLASDVTVTATEPDGSTPGSSVVSVVLPSVLAPLVAAASAAGDAAIVLVGGASR